jgi:hypothetical protein
LSKNEKLVTQHPPPPSRQLRAPRLGEYKADYSPLSAEDLAEQDPEVEELFRNSVTASP